MEQRKLGSFLKRGRSFARPALLLGSAVGTDFVARAFSLGTRQIGGNPMRRNGHATATIPSSKHYQRAAETTARKGRAIQRTIDQTDKKSGGEKKAQAMQAGARIYPMPPLSKQHLKKPGL